MTRRDAFLGLVAGFLIGLFSIPVLYNIDFAAKIPHMHLTLLVGVPSLTLVGVLVAGFIGRRFLIIWQIAKFILIGFLNTAVDFGVLNALVFATGYDKGWPIAALNVAATAIAVTNSYFWNRRWVFESARGPAGVEFAEFVLVSVSAIFIGSGIVAGVTTYISPMFGLTSEQWVNVAKGMASVFSMIWNFIGYKFVVFRRS
jgi:putative flippase GtrA